MYIKKKKMYIYLRTWAEVHFFFPSAIARGLGMAWGRAGCQSALAMCCPWAEVQFFFQVRLPEDWAWPEDGQVVSLR